MAATQPAIAPSMLSLALPSGIHLPAASTRPAGFLLVAGAHIALLLALLSLDRTAPVLMRWVPLTVSLLPAPRHLPQPLAVPPAAVHRPAPSRAQAAPALPPQPAPAAQPLALPPLATRDDAAALPRAFATPAATAPAAEPAPAAATPASPTPAPATALPPPRRQLAPSAVQYRVLPPVEVPRAARRAGESGTVWLRVVVDVTGAPAQVSLHRSSGFARLDEQALWAMRQARFRPHSEDGRAVEVEVIAPIEYPAD